MDTSISEYSHAIELEIRPSVVYTEKKKFDDTDIIVVPRPILYWRFTENQGLLVLVQPVCLFQTYELLFKVTCLITCLLLY